MTVDIGLGSSFGVMQGRLSTQTSRGYQAFPWESWQSEFDLASERGLGHIEWVADSWRVSENPLVMNPETVSRTAKNSRVAVVSVCADFLMDTPLEVGVPGPWRVLSALVESMSELGAKWLVIPCVDSSSLRDASSLVRFMRSAEELAGLLGGSEIKVSVESDLGPADFAHLLDALDPTIFGVNYDIGNSASLGYESGDEIDAYGSRISLVHVKDRVRGGQSVPLGQGDADIPGVFRRLKTVGFAGPVTMQAYRDQQGLDVLDRQLDWLQSCALGEA